MWPAFSMITWLLCNNIWLQRKNMLHAASLATGQVFGLGFGYPAFTESLDTGAFNLIFPRLRFFCGFIAPTTFIPKGLFTFPHPNEVGLVISVKAGFVVIDAVINLSTWGQVLRWNWVHNITIVLITKVLAS
jgi:hypothetical protein